MAANLSQKRALPVDYKQLNLFSSTVLFDTARKLKKGKFYEVEKIITRRRIRYVSFVDDSIYTRLFTCDAAICCVRQNVA